MKVEMIDMTEINGAKPLLPPFKIPFKPKWDIFIIFNVMRWLINFCIWPMWKQCLSVDFSFGVWKIEATYSETFETMATAEFEVKEYGKSEDLMPLHQINSNSWCIWTVVEFILLYVSVLPSISLHIKPEENYISAHNLDSFKMKISAKCVLQFCSLLSSIFNYLL